MNRLFTIVLLLVISACLPSCSFYRFVTGRSHGKKIVIAGTDSAAVAKVSSAGIYKDSIVMPHDAAGKANHNPNPLIAELTPLWTKRLDFKTYSGKAKMRF